MKQLEMGDIDFVICILNERRNRLTNDYSPLAQKLAQAVRTLEKLRK
jgi:hypothetical protein